MTGLSDSTLKMFGTDNDEVVGCVGSSRADEIVENWAKSKNIKNSSKVKNFAKAKYLEQSIFLSSKATSVLVIKDDSDWHFLITNWGTT